MGPHEALTATRIGASLIPKEIWESKEKSETFRNLGLTTTLLQEYYNTMKEYLKQTDPPLNDRTKALITQEWVEAVVYLMAKTELGPPEEAEGWILTASEICTLMREAQARD